MHVCNSQRILQPLIITSFFTQKHWNYHLKGPISEKSAEMYGEGNELQLCVGDCKNSYDADLEHKTHTLWTKENSCTQHSKFLKKGNHFHKKIQLLWDFNLMILKIACHEYYYIILFHIGFTVTQKHVPLITLPLQLGSNAT